jgi:hypothetical protein
VRQLHRFLYIILLVVRCEIIMHPEHALDRALHRHYELNQCKIKSNNSEAVTSINQNEGSTSIEIGAFIYSESVRVGWLLV